MAKSLQEMARQAKERISTGYWQEEKNIISNKVMTNTHTRNEYMYQIVASIMDSDEVVTNPLDRVMDKEYFNSLDEHGRVKYIMELSREYVKMSEEYTRVKEERSRIAR